MVVVIAAATVAIWVYLLFFRGGFWWLPYRPAPISASIGGRSVVAVIPARDEADVIGGRYLRCWRKIMPAGRYCRGR